jgi:hypothetical protein
MSVGYTPKQLLSGRDDIDKAVQAAGKDIYKGGVALGPMLWDGIVAVSKKHRVDPGYVFFSIESFIPKLTGKDRMALRVAYKLYLMSPHQASEMQGLPPASDEPRVDMALRDLARWAKDDFVYEIAKLSVDTAKKYAGRVQAEMASQGAPVSHNQGAKIILSELPIRTRDHPWWFSQGPLVYDMLDLFLDI